MSASLLYRDQMSGHEGVFPVHHHHHQHSHRSLEWYYQHATPDTLILPQSYLLFYSSNDHSLTQHHEHLRIQHDTIEVGKPISCKSNTSTVLFDRLASARQIHTTRVAIGSVVQPIRPAKPVPPPKPPQLCGHRGEMFAVLDHQDGGALRRCSADCAELYRQNEHANSSPRRSTKQSADHEDRKTQKEVGMEANACCQDNLISLSSQTDSALALCSSARSSKTPMVMGETEEGDRDDDKKTDMALHYEERQQESGNTESTRADGHCLQPSREMADTRLLHSQRRAATHTTTTTTNSVTKLVARFELEFQSKPSRLSRSFSCREPRRSFHEVPSQSPPNSVEQSSPPSTMLLSKSSDLHKCAQTTTTGSKGVQCYNCCCCCCERCKAPQSMLGVALKHDSSRSTSKCTTDSCSPSPNAQHHHHHHHQQRLKHKVKTNAAKAEDYCLPPKPVKKRVKSRPSSEGDPVLDVETLKPTQVDLEESGKSSSNELLSTSSANSGDNSSTDEGIENPTLLEEYDEEDDKKHDFDGEPLKINTPEGDTSGHTHHEHHHNHHHAHNEGAQHLEQILPSSEYVSNHSPNITGSVVNFNKLRQEELNLLREIKHLEQQTLKPKSELVLPVSSEDHEDDEELIEFQKIEQEIKLSELRKCLGVVQKQIHNYQRRMSFDEAMHKLEDQVVQQQHFPTSMTDSMIERSRKTAEDQLDVNCLRVAPLAEHDTDTESVRLSQQELATKATSTSSQEANDSHAMINGMAKLVLSDADDDSDEENDRGNYRQLEEVKNINLDDERHDSIETSLSKVNKVHDDDDDDDEGSFILDTNNKSSGGVRRRGSRYDNERSHRRCDLVHHSTGVAKATVSVDRMLERIMPQTATPYYTSLMSESLGELINNSTIDSGGFDPRSQQCKSNNELKPRASQAIDTLSLLAGVENAGDEGVVMRRRSARFPNETSGQKQQENEEENGNALRMRQVSKSTGSMTNSQRPLTLYLPAPNQELNLIKHLHALGHDLTSSIVTNHLLLTPFTCSGYLYKQCASSTHKWRKRYFHFNRIRKVFVYFTDRSAFEKKRHPKRGVFFDEIQDLYVDHTRINAKKLASQSAKEKNAERASSSCSGGALRPSSPLSRSACEKRKLDGTRRIFVVSTTTSSCKFTLSTYQPELMRIWMDVIFTGASAYLHDLEMYDEEHS